MKVCGIDGDMLAYAAGYSVEHKEYKVYFKETGDLIAQFRYKKDYLVWKDNWKYTDDDVDVEPVVVMDGDEYIATSNLSKMLKKIANRTGTYEQKIFLTGEGNYREEVATIRPYKGNRPSGKPVYHQQLRDFLLRDRDATLIEGMEADDAMSMFMYEPHEGEDRCLAVVDKDLHMVPGEQYDFKKDKTTVWKDGKCIEEFYYQILRGDAVDNIPGIKGLGEVKARRAINGWETEEEMLDIVCSLYEKQYGTEWLHAMHEVCQLLWMSEKEPNDYLERMKERVGEHYYFEELYDMQTP